MEEIKKIALEFIESQRGEAKQISREIWNFSEIALEEFKSSELLVEVLQQY